eukprot:TRINITY_DN2395_c0_g1_i1.p1 TRINITY_DN2395_c0_g1~~TRINITY_DN2395_c0_g1_i1.p1  ORF type:complete len:276 (-),score=49.49 TRINITY_DN2395_c0_g1_i1:108-935(-)
MSDASATPDTTPSPSTTSTEKSHVEFAAGNVPVLLVAGHGGTRVLDDVPERSTGFMEGDTHTAEVMEALYDSFSDSFRPYFVKGLAHRRFCDLNRPLSTAMDEPFATFYYDTYHGQILSYIREAQRQHPNLPCILLDLHGQSEKSDHILRGTKNGATVADLEASLGSKFLLGSSSIFGHLSSAGYQVFPPVDTSYEDVKEHPHYNGGFTVRRFSGVTKIDEEDFQDVSCIQLEIGDQFRRNKDTVASFSKDLAQSICTFWEEVSSASTKKAVKGE